MRYYLFLALFTLLQFSVTSYFKEAKALPTFFLQVREVKGVVLDSKSQPLAHAHVLVKGSDLSVYTNENGEFRIKLPSEFEGLVVESQGYKTQEVRITGFEKMTIQLATDPNAKKVAINKKTSKDISKQLAIESSSKKKITERSINLKGTPSTEVEIIPTKNILSEYDVCVFGSSSAGVVAAYTIAKKGKSVILISGSDHIGGLSSGGLGQTDIGNKHVVKGISRDFYRRLGSVYGNLESWQFEPKEASNVFKQYIQDAQIPFITNYNLQSVSKVNGAITQITVVSNTSDVKTIKAKTFIDASYEGDLLAKAGVSFIVGRESNQTYNENYNGVYLPKYRAESSGYHQFPDNISPYKIPNDPKSGLLFGVQDAKLENRGSGDKTVQAYNFRITLTDSLENQIAITRPHNYDSTKYELLVRLFAAQPTMREINDYFIWSRMPNRKTDVNNRGAFSTDYIGANYNYALASVEERKKIFEDHLAYTQGLLYFYASDNRVPKELSDYVKKWGYPKDEFTAFNNFTPQLYVREARRMIGERVMTEHHCLGHETVQDGIAYAAYTMDSHNTQRLIVDGMVKNEGNVEVGGFPPYPISYGSIVPQRTEVTNLIVPICMSASHIAYGSIRMEPVFMLLGQVAGLAATMSIDENKIVQEVDYRKINQLMDDDPYIQEGFKDIVIDSKGLGLVQKSGWTKKEHKTYFSNELAVSKDQNKFTVNIKDVKPSKYKVYYFVPVVSEIYNDPIYSFTFNKEKFNVDFMDHLNDWYLLGEIDLTKQSSANLEIENDTNVVFNAIQLVPIVD